jgi:hypothetical protein
MCWALIRRSAGAVAMSGGLDGTEVATVAEDGEEIARHGVGQLGVGTGRRAEVAGVAAPVLGVLENVEQMAFGHAGADLPFEIRQAVRLPGRPRLFQVGRAVGVERQLGVVGETGVHSGGGAGQLVL